MKRGPLVSMQKGQGVRVHLEIVGLGGGGGGGVLHEAEQGVAGLGGHGAALRVGHLLAHLLQAGQQTRQEHSSIVRVVHQLQCNKKQVSFQQLFDCIHSIKLNACCLSTLTKEQCMCFMNRGDESAWLSITGEANLNSQNQYVVRCKHTEGWQKEAPWPCCR